MSLATVLSGLIFLCIGFQSTDAAGRRSITIKDNDFLLDGEQFRYVAGSLHYFRLPHQYWRDRLRKLRAAGLNAVATYVEWSFHETEERQYSWSGDRDLKHFIELAAEENLLVLLRPGPYICAERDLGGLPYWLLSKYPDIELRTTDSNFIKEVRIWFRALFERITPLLYGNGGPVILVQVENEYGSYACEKPYMEEIRNIIRSHVGEAALLYTTDGAAPSMITCGSVNDTLTTIDFGSGTNPVEAFRVLRKIMPSGPLVNSEYYPGWLTHWSEEMQRVETAPIVKNLKAMLKFNASVNFYVFFGGTNFEFTSGANYASVYQPDITSYDYDAPLTEYGNITDKYIAIKKALEEIHPWAIDLTVNTSVSTAYYGSIELEPQVHILSENGRRIFGKNCTVVIGATLPTFESCRQRAGLLLYETVIPPGDRTRLLIVTKPRDRVYVYVDRVYMGVISRMDRIESVVIRVNNNSVVSLLVENQGRIGFGSQLKDFKGILGVVKLDNQILNGTWKVLSYHLEHFNVKHRHSATRAKSEAMTHGPALFSGQFRLREGDIPRDTFLNPEGWGKGYAWINGYNLGRYWLEPGPQITLYLPGVYLRPYPQINLIQMLELESSSNQIELVANPK